MRFSIGVPIPSGNVTDIWNRSDKGSLFSQFRSLSRGLRDHFSMTIQSSPSPVQDLYDYCKKTFTPSGVVPLSSQAIHNLGSLMDTIRPVDVGLKAEVSEDDRGHGVFGLGGLNRTARWAQPITYLDMHECDCFTMCIFCLPTSAVIPLHDHPGMTVFSKVLYGSMHVKAYDWVEPARVIKSMGPEHVSVRLARLSADKILTAPCGTSVLHPKSGGNLHCFTALTPCAVLDILAPPYLETAERRCTYYHDYPYSSFSTEGGVASIGGKQGDYAWLAEIQTPEDLYMRQQRYTGPAIKV